MGFELQQERKWERSDRLLVFLLITIPCALRLWIQVPLDNDTFFLLSHGRYVLQHGLPSLEPFTFHEGLRFVMQQWLTASIFYYIYSVFDYNGLYVLAFVLYVLYGYSAYRLSMLLSNDNMPISATAALLVCVGMGYFIVLRPWLFSGLIFLAEFYCLELHIKTRKSGYLVFLPMLSLLLINLHAAVWPLFFVFLVPYVLDGLRIPIKTPSLHQYGARPILLFGILAFLAGLANPYFLDAMLYFYNSYGNKYVNIFIIEMGTPSFKDMRGLVIFAMYAFVAIAYAINKAGTSRMRYVFLTLLTAYMGLSSARNVQYFLLTAPFLAYYYRDFDIIAATNCYKKKPDIYTYSKVGLVIILYSIIIFGAPRNSEKKFFETFVPARAIDFLLQNFDTQSIRLFNDYDTGDFLEFKGIRTFIDSRAEVFFKSNNGKEDILDDYFEVLLGKVHYMDLVKKYRFTHYLVIRGTLMDTYLSRDNAFALLYQDEKYRIFEGLDALGVVLP
ncbi:MAG: hypothetical protein GX443_06150 [Deltaproteobacteria bacterium]|nr:hypothetical protein [Deltaproteobacteria bacterium]